MGFRVQGLGFRVWGFGFRFLCLRAEGFGAVFGVLGVRGLLLKSWAFRRIGVQGLGLASFFVFCLF